jgi:hypothetical protein
LSWNVKLTCVIINRNNFRARIFNQIQIPARETSWSLGSRLCRSPLAIRDRLVGKSIIACDMLWLTRFATRFMKMSILSECKLPEEYDNMILCDLCGQWFHFRCVEYDTSLSTSNEWLCRLCTPPAAKKFVS